MKKEYIYVTKKVREKYGLAGLLLVVGRTVFRNYLVLERGNENNVSPLMVGSLYHGLTEEHLNHVNKSHPEGLSYYVILKRDVSPAALPSTNVEASYMLEEGHS